MYFAKGLLLLLLQTLLLFHVFRFGSSRDTITIGQPIRDGNITDILVSNGESTFALGFFSPKKNPTYRFVGIWYNTLALGPVRTVVWVANRDRAIINDTSGVLSIDLHGNLVLYVKDRINQPVWSTNIIVSKKSSKNNNSTILAQLLDSGNLILFHNETSKVLWQSFDYPTDTTIPGMKLGLDRTTGLNRILTSRKSEGDPGTGNCSYKLDTNGSPELVLYKGNVPRWRSSHWTGHGWSGLPLSNPGSFFNISFVNNQREVTMSWSILDSIFLARLVLHESGSVQKFIRKKTNYQWRALYSEPSDLCDNYGKCGAFGKCLVKKNGTEFECMCLPGFEPRSQSEWSVRNVSSGCMRKRGNGEKSLCRSSEGRFEKVENVKVPDT